MLDVGCWMRRKLAEERTGRLLKLRLLFLLLLAQFSLVELNLVLV